ncbi:MAG: glutaredoxin family protein [Solirubrobacterales bacterium]
MTDDAATPDAAANRARNIVLYTTAFCGYCQAAKRLLTQRGIPYEEIHLGRDMESREALVEKTGLMTFPQLLVDDEPIGGFDTMAALDRAGQLGDLAVA